MILEPRTPLHVPAFSSFEEDGVSYSVDGGGPNWIAVEPRGQEILDQVQASGGGISFGEVVKAYASRHGIDGVRAWVHVHEFLSAVARAGMLFDRASSRTPYPGRLSLAQPLGLRELWIQINNACNISCAHCLVSSGPGKEAGLPEDRLSALIDRAVALGVERVYITGGEPMLRPDLFGLLRRVTDKAGTEAIVLTNAMLLSGRNRAEVATLDRSRVRFQVSIDGARRETNDAVRGRGSFDRALEGARTLADLGFQVSVTTVATRGNLEELPAIPDLVRSVGAVSHHLMWSFRRGRAAEGADGFLPPSESLVPAVLLVADAAERAGVLLDNLESVKRRVNGVPGVKYDLGNGGWDSLCVHHDGRVYPTAALAGERDLLCGDVLAEDLGEILDRSPVVRRLRELTLARKPGALDDPYRFLTGGGDWEHAWWLSGDPLGRDPYYPVTLALIRRAMTALGREKLRRRTARSTSESPLVLHVMGEGAIACGTADPAAAESPVLPLHSNCVLSFDVDKPRARVREYYSAAAETPQADLCCPVSYDPSLTAHIPRDVIDRFYGCGSPVALAGISPGETVLDLGSGAGIDVFIAARLVGEKGRSIGVDMTDRMLAVAAENVPVVARNLGYDVVEFREGYLERIPVDSGTVDVVTSNCVINLSPDKPRVFEEIWRVLKDHGRLVVSDIVSDREVPPHLKVNPRLWGECLVGALTEEAFIAGLERVGFQAIEVLRSAFWREVEGYAFRSVTVRGWKCQRPLLETIVGHRAVYLGPGKAIVDEAGRIYPRHVPVFVSAERAAQLRLAPYRTVFAVLEPGDLGGARACCGPGERSSQAAPGGSACCS